MSFPGTKKWLEFNQWNLRATTQLSLAERFNFEKGCKKFKNKINKITIRVKEFIRKMRLLNVISPSPLV